MSLRDRILRWWHRDAIARRRAERIERRFKLIERKAWDAYINEPDYGQARRLLTQIWLIEIEKLRLLRF